jgi:4-amino-4-deoxy-L-arabinose transferase-like glycosyltransferase
VSASRIFYTDVFSVFCATLLIFLFVLAIREEKLSQSKRNKKLLYYILFGIALGIAYLFKPTTIFPAFSLIIILLIRMICKEIKFRDFLKYVVCILLPCCFIIISITAIATSTIFSNFNFKQRNAIEEKSIVNFIAVGVSDHCEDNSRNLSQMDQYRGQFGGMSRCVNLWNDFETREERMNWAINQINNQMSSRDLASNIEFFYNKMVFNFDGTFNVHRSINGNPQYYFSGPLDTKDFYRNYTIQNDIYSNFVRCFWVVLLLLISCGFFIRNLSRDKKYIFTFLYFTLGIELLYLLLCESESRYLYPYLPAIIILSLLNIGELYKPITKAIARRNRNPKTLKHSRGNSYAI